MVKRNSFLKKLSPSYLFPEINKNKNLFLQKNPDAKLIHLGIGDTTQKIPEKVAEEMKKASFLMGTKEGYSGYGPEQGSLLLREKIAENVYNNRMLPEEIFVSDGAKCDIGRLQVLFGNHISVAVQDPSYPVYVDGTIIMGGEKIHYLACHPGNNFFPDTFPEVDLFYLCSPNNPTGHVLKKEQLTKLVEHATKTKSLIIFDAAYSAFISDPDLPKSIYEIEGADQVAIEVNSFSKSAGFTGIRLGWVVVPKNVKYDDGINVHSDFQRIYTTLFNGASKISQVGGLAVFEEESWFCCQKTISYYLENSKNLKNVFIHHGKKVYGGDHAPYVWVHFQERTSWESFHFLLEYAHLVTIPGSGFGKNGEGFIRLSGFGGREETLEACRRLDHLLKENLPLKSPMSDLHELSSI